MLLGKVLLSTLVLAWLVSDLDRARLGQVGGAVAPGWLALAFGLKAGSLWLHEARIWMALPEPRPPLGAVVRLCLGVGLLNLVLPARGGDIAVIAALYRRWAIPVGTATAVIGVTSFLEAVAFGAVLLAVLVHAASGPLRDLELVAIDQSTSLLVGGAAAGVVGLAVAAVVLLGRWRADKPRPAGVLGIAHRTVVDTAGLLTSPQVLASNTGAAVLQVGLLVGAFGAGVAGAGIDPRLALPVGAEVLAISSLASLVLPSSWGVGPAAASKLVLAAHGVGAEEALVYAGAYWLIAHLPFLLVGLPALWSLRAAR